MPKVIAFVSGKGGTGKTSVAGGVASCLAAMNYKTLCLDMDIGLRNLDIVIGLSDLAVLDFCDVIWRNASPEDAIVAHPEIKNLYLLTAPTMPVENMPDMPVFLDLIDQLRGQFDYILIDCPAGLGRCVRYAAAAADLLAVVCTPDAVSLRDARHTVETLMEAGASNLKLVVNRVRMKLVRRNDEYNIDDSMDKTGLALLGVVPEDENVIACANHGEPMILHCHKGAVLAYYNIANRLTGSSVPALKFW